MSAVRKTSARSAMILAPLLTYSVSGYPASTPAAASNTTSRPTFARLGITAGTSATRRSPGKLSRGTPTIMKPPRWCSLFRQQNNAGDHHQRIHRKSAFYLELGESPSPGQSDSSLRENAAAPWRPQQSERGLFFHGRQEQEIARQRAS